MAEERPKETALLKTISDLMIDLADLLQKELRLAKAEIAANISRKLRAGMWMSAAALLGFLSLLLAVQAIVFALIASGLAPYWACLIVALVAAGLASLAFLKGRADASAGLAPDRALNQIKEDIKSTKEQLA